MLYVLWDNPIIFFPKGNYSNHIKHVSICDKVTVHSMVEKNTYVHQVSQGRGEDVDEREGYRYFFFKKKCLFPFLDPEKYGT